MSSAESTAWDQFEIKRGTDGPLSFEVLGVEFNPGSSLQRESILFNDLTCPIQVSENSMSFGYGGDHFGITSATDLLVCRPVAALELVHILFDVFGRHLRTLPHLEIRDLPPGPTSLRANWDLLDTKNSAELLSTVTYIARVRNTDGTQWVFNSQNLLRALSNLRLEIPLEVVETVNRRP